MKIKLSHPIRNHIILWWTGTICNTTDQYVQIFMDLTVERFLQKYHSTVSSNILKKY